MEDRANNIRVGAVVGIAIIFAVVGISWLKGITFGKKYKEVVALFDNGGGLKEGDAVTVLGVKKGKVSHLTFHKGHIKVLMEISNDVVLRKDAKAWIVDAGIMGDKRVYIEPGDSMSLLPLGTAIEGGKSVGLSETIVSLGTLASEVKEMVGLVKKDLLNEENARILNETLKDLRVASNEFRKLVEQNSGQLKTASVSFKEGAVGFKEIIHENKGGVKQVISDLRIVAARLDTISTRLNNKDGTLSKLATDKELYDNLKKTTKDMDELIKDIQANPKKYLSIKVF